MPEGKPTIWVVDDEASMQGLLRDFLEFQGFEVTCFGSAVDALKALHEKGPPDAVVSDVRMTPMNGLSFLRIAKRDFPDLPFVLFTGAGAPGEREQAIRFGACHYLTKPFPLSELKVRLDLCLQGRKTG